ncbi:MAG: Integral membrane protein, partial [uncultured Blastococcus sp.]
AVDCPGRARRAEGVDRAGPGPVLGAGHRHGPRARDRRDGRHRRSGSGAGPLPRPVAPGPARGDDRPRGRPRDGGAGGRTPAVGHPVALGHVGADRLGRQADGAGHGAHLRRRLHRPGTLRTGLGRPPRLRPRDRPALGAAGPAGAVARADPQLVRTVVGAGHRLRRLRRHVVAAAAGADGVRGAGHLVPAAGRPEDRAGTAGQAPPPRRGAELRRRPARPADRDPRGVLGRGLPAGRRGRAGAGRPLAARL